MNRRRRLPSFLILLLVVVSGCSTSSTEPTKTSAPGRSPTPVVTADPALASQRGEALFFGDGQCSVCHSIDGEERATGPDLSGIASRADAAYLHQSIVDVDAAAPEGWRTDLMPPNYAELLTRQQIDDLVAFMLTLE